MKTKKILALALAAVLLMGVTVAGTIAYLTAETGTVTNTFKPTAVDVEIDEHEYLVAENKLGTGLVGEGGTEDDYKLVPGLTMPKDPFVTIPAGSESVHVYIKVTKSTDFDDYVTATVNTAVWEQVSGTDDVWYLKAGPVDTSNTTGTNAKAGPYYILTGTTDFPNGAVTVASNITLDGGEGNVKMPTTNPEIKFEAFVIQSATFADANAAYDAVY